MILYIYCAGGFGKEVIDVARRKNNVLNLWTDIKFIDDIRTENYYHNAEVLKFDQITDAIEIEDSEFIIASGEPIARCKLFEKLRTINVDFTNLVDISSLVSDSALLGNGVFVAPFCSISSSVVLSENSCVNTMSIIGHDVCVGKNSVISSMVNLGGTCIIGAESYIGMGALVKEGVKIGSNSIVGMGSVVYNDIPDGMIAIGNPARVSRPNADQKVFK
ncbi:NeuD/PglB/VioB family sugar acetyltransferase [Polynucleobacter sp. HIN7]|uniref:NeuD/PglB/VioB family sugar acetyltransferase n=1 Tax=Polynucleobacter sp. HIN7 TaxID=3047866 RepID=UPI002572B85E|nr:NeuD/PglB/VioB family sugar acetyltransferase [Polynucleobacter sp. HIN7]BEI36589.1 acetyltransferase [Polynucleobacter sp. HIN7]